MPKLQDTLQQAVSTVFDLMDNGETARSAILKTASGHHLLPDQVTRLCQLYNRSASITQRIAPAELSIKLADAQIVDPREVLKELTERKTQKTAAFPVCSLASQLVTSTRQTLGRSEPKYSGAITNRKTASLSDSDTTLAVDRYAGIHHGVKGSDLVELREGIKRKIAGYQHDGAQMLSYMEAQSEIAARAVENLTQQTNLSNYKEASYWLQSHHPEVVPLLELLATSVGTVYQQQKVASLPASTEPPVTWTNGVTGPGSAVACLVKLANAVEQFKSQVPELAAKIAALREEDYIIRTHMRNGEVVNRDVVIGGQTLKQQQLDHVRKVANMVNSYIGSMLAKKTTAEPSMSKLEKFKLQLQHPQHEATLRSIRSRAALQSLLVDDPVIASHPEGDVLGAYNEISSYAPNVTENPATLRSVLRQYLQNNSSSFDLSQLRSLERTGGLPKAT